MRDFRDIQDAAAKKSNFAAVFVGEIENLLQTMNGAAEAGND